MRDELDQTHDPALRSWVESANEPGHDFPIQNLPFGVFRRSGTPEAPRIGVAIGDEVLDLALCARAGLLPAVVAPRAVDASLNGLLALGQPHWRELRNALSALLAAGAPPRATLLAPQRDIDMLLPAQVGDYSDAYASIHHATNVGRLFRPDSPLLPNYKYVPVTYHGRASSLVAGGAPVRRPMGQRLAAGDVPAFGPSVHLDYEVEIGALMGPGNALGERLPLSVAGERIFGLCLVNDWSARDIQRWEYQPLGPFLSKSFATSVGPWVVTLDALAPFRTTAAPRAPGDPPPLPYLLDADDQARGGFAITVMAAIRSERMRAEGAEALWLSRTSFAAMYWTLAQLVAHHASNGCNLRPGDLIASGTVSGPEPGARGCLLELTEGGRIPVELPGGERRIALADGDEVTLSAYCERPGYTRIGFGTCSGVVLGASTQEEQERRGEAAGPCA